MQRIKTIQVMFIVALLLSGCATSRSTNIYTEGEALQAEDIEEGVVESVAPATIRKEETFVGPVGGTMIGGIAGSTLGGGKGREIFSVAGAMIGSWLGHHLEQGVTDRNAFKIIVKLNNGEKIVIVQEADVPFQAGERVNVFSSRTSHTKRVAKIVNSASPTE